MLRIRHLEREVCKIGYRRSNNNYKIGFGTILELSKFNSILKVSLWENGCLRPYKDCFDYILK